MTRLAFLFPGQGSQHAGMGQALCQHYPSIAADYFERADRILGFSISRLCFEGPEEELVKTEIQQPAIFLVSVATHAVLRAQGIEPEAMAGHSLGEYAALAAAGALDFEDGLRVTRRRGELMAEVAEQTGGIMAAVMGLPSDAVESLCWEAQAKGVVEVANFNSPSQTVVSGQPAAVRAVMDLARERGARRVTQLNVSAPFHCSLMAKLTSEFRPVLEEASLRDPCVPVVANVTAREEQTADEVRRNLIAQLASPVHWTASMQHLLGAGFDTFVEVGPGRVLSKLMRSIDRDATAYHTDDLEALAQVGQLLSVSTRP